MITITLASFGWLIAALGFTCGILATLFGILVTKERKNVL